MPCRKATSTDFACSTGWPREALKPLCFDLRPCCSVAIRFPPRSRTDASAMLIRHSRIENHHEKLVHCAVLYHGGSFPLIPPAQCPLLHRTPSKATNGHQFGPKPEESKNMTSSQQPRIWPPSTNSDWPTADLELMLWHHPMARTLQEKGQELVQTAWS